MNVSCLEPKGLLQNLVDKGGNGSFESRIRFLVLDVESYLLGNIRTTALIAEFLNRLSAQAEILFDGAVNGTGRGEDDLEAFAQQQAQVALFHLPGRLA